MSTKRDHPCQISSSYHYYFSRYDLAATSKTCCCHHFEFFQLCDTKVWHIRVSVGCATVLFWDCHFELLKFPPFWIFETHPPRPTLMMMMMMKSEWMIFLRPTYLGLCSRKIWSQSEHFKNLKMFWFFWWCHHGGHFEIFPRNSLSYTN